MIGLIPPLEILIKLTGKNNNNYNYQIIFKIKKHLKIKNILKINVNKKV